MVPNELVTKRFGPPGLKYAMQVMGYQPGIPREPLQEIKPKSEAADLIRNAFEAFKQ